MKKGGCPLCGTIICDPCPHCGTVVPNADQREVRVRYDKPSLADTDIAVCRACYSSMTGKRLDTAFDVLKHYWAERGFTGPLEYHATITNWGEEYES